MQIEVFNFIIDFTELINATNKGALPAMWYIFINGAWIPFAYLFITQGYQIWLMLKQNKWFSTIKFTLLAVDIPKNHEQTPKAVEGLFSTVSGAHAAINNVDKYIKGQFQLAFSFEIVSIDGYVQFLVRTPIQHRDVVESAVYAQYPDAEITEVEDYTTWAPSKYPDDNYNVWGTEIVPVANEAIPIRTYPLFEDKVSGEYKDPLAALLETMSKIHVGEQVWFQIFVRPTGTDWLANSEKLAYKLAGKKKAAPPASKGNQAVDFIMNTIDNIGEFIYPLWKEKKDNKKEDLPSMMLHLTPGEKSTIEAIENKAGKIGFECKIRLVYISPKEDFAPPRVVSSVFGAIKQFSTLDLNGFKPDAKTKTSTNYWFTKYRNNRRRERIIAACKGRSGSMGHQAFILNLEELATLWHFPGVEVRTPLLHRTEVKKSEAPSSLPIASLKDNVSSEKEELLTQLKKPAFNVDLDNNYFENKFASNKNSKEIASLTSAKGEAPSNLPIE